MRLFMRAPLYQVPPLLTSPMIDMISGIFFSEILPVFCRRDSPWRSGFVPLPPRGRAAARGGDAAVEVCGARALRVVRGGSPVVPGALGAQRGENSSERRRGGARRFFELAAEAELGA